MSTDLNIPGYIYDGETVEVAGPITAAQHAGIFDALGVTQGIPDHDPARRDYTFEPAGPAQGDALRRYLRERQVAHASERLNRWAPSNDTAASTPPDPDEAVIEELVALVGPRGIETDKLDEYVHDAVAAHASEVNNSGVEAQIRFLLDEFGAKETRRIVESERISKF
jgi:hypothetical protein